MFCYGPIKDSGAFSADRLLVLAQHLESRFLTAHQHKNRPFSTMTTLRRIDKFELKLQTVIGRGNANFKRLSVG